MISKKKFNTIGEIQRLQELATLCKQDVGLHSLDGSIRIDAKSFVGMFALNFDEPILVVSESKSFHKEIKDIGENL